MSSESNAARADTASRSLEVAVDNDVLIKVACYRLSSAFLRGRAIAVLGAARYVVLGSVRRRSLAGDRQEVLGAAAELIEQTHELEPTERELEVAGAIELAAQRAGLPLDAGESQLAAVVAERSIPILETGDKRAVRSFEALLEDVPDLRLLAGKVRCLEQIFAHHMPVDAETLRAAVCAEPGVDKALSICFSCFSPIERVDEHEAGLLSYIALLRLEAPSVLEASA